MQGDGFLQKHLRSDKENVRSYRLAGFVKSSCQMIKIALELGQGGLHEFLA